MKPNLNFVSLKHVNVLDVRNLMYMCLDYGEEHAYLNSCSNNDAHEEVGDNASNCHH